MILFVCRPVGTQVSSGGVVVFHGSPFESRVSIDSDVTPLVVETGSSPERGRSWKSRERMKGAGRPSFRGKRATDRVVF